MIKVYVKKQSNFAISTPTVKKIARTFLSKNGIVSDADLSIAFVSIKKMLQVAKTYLHENKIHNVLSFTSQEAQDRFILPPDKIIHLGEIIICYPQAVKEAAIEGILIDEKIRQLLEHGCLHLLGVHHD